MLWRRVTDVRTFQPRRILCRPLCSALVLPVLALSLGACGGQSSSEREAARVSQACRPITARLEGEASHRRSLSQYLSATVPLLEAERRAQETSVSGAWLEPILHVEEARDLVASQMARALDSGRLKEAAELAPSVAELHMDVTLMAETAGASACAYWPFAARVGQAPNAPHRRTASVRSGAS